MNRKMVRTKSFILRRARDSANKIFRGDGKINTDMSLLCASKCVLASFLRIIKLCVSRELKRLIPF